MAAVTAALVKELREMTGAGMMDCKKALTATEGDMDKAVEFLREKGLAGAAKKAVVKCQGHTCHTGTKFDYQGVTTCSAAAKMFGGPGDCAYGCLGLGDCASVCPFGAIQVVDGVARVINEKCTGCGACAKVCPKFVIEIVEDDVKPMVLCNNKDKGAATRKACKVGCIGCKRCEKVCPIETAKAKAVTVDGFLANIDADLCIGCMQCAEACPVGAIDVPNCR